MDPAEKKAIKEKMEKKGVGFDKAAEELKADIAAATAAGGARP